MTRLRFSILFSLILFMGIGCGQGGNHTNQNPNAPSGSNASSNLQSPSPQAIEGDTTPQTEDDFSYIKTQVQDTPQNRAFASSKIGTAEVDYVEDKPQVKVTFQGEKNPVIFSGDLKPSDSGYVGEFTDTTGAHPDLQVAATCNDKDCTKADLIFQNKDGTEAGTHVTHEEYNMHLIVPSDETQQEMKDAGLTTYSKDRPVDVISSSTLYGKDIVSITDLITKKALYVPLTKTEGDTLPTSDSATTLYGKSADEIVLRITKPIKNPRPKEEKTAVAYLEIKPKTTAPPLATVPVVVPAQCPVNISGEVSPLVTSYLKDCTHPLVLKYVDFWTKQGGNKTSLTNFMKLYEESQNQPESRQALEMQKMVSHLHMGNLPDVWSLVTLVESSFNPDHEDGVWQITVLTANALKLPLADRRKIVPATDAVARYFNTFLAHYAGDTELSLAAYNAGECGVDTHGEKDHCKDNILAQHSYPATVFKLCEIAWGEHLKNAACVYAPKIVAAMTIVLAPSTYGVTEVTPMEGK